MSRRLDRVLLAGLLLLLAAALARAATLAWICDDAFISLRYADNLVAGHGLVYNVGERVEGYTNLLWTLLLAALRRAGVEARLAAEVPGLVAYAWLAASLAWLGWRRSRDAGRPLLPLAAALVLVSPDFHVWATGGLETMLFTALAVQGLVLTRTGGGPGRALLAGTLLALALLTRPDGLLFAAAGVLSWAVPPARLAPRRRLLACAAAAAPTALALAVWIPWKLAYYGDPFPTAFYSKSAAHPYASQGLVYLGLYLAQNWWLLAAAAWVLAGAVRRSVAVPADASWDDRFFLGTAALFAAYVVYVGGDFMASRRLLPAAPLLFLALEGRLARWPSARGRVWLAALALAGASLPLPLFSLWPTIRGVGDERAFYPPAAIDARRQQAEAVGSALASTPARVAFEGGMCVFGYYSGLPYLVELTGLTQYWLAKQPLAERGAIGHEKVASDAMLREHEVNLLVSQDFPPVSRPRDRLAVDEVYFGDRARARVLVYSDAVMDRLRGAPGIDFVPIERTLELSARRMARVPPEEAREIEAGLDVYYFDHAGPRGRERREALHRRVESLRRGAGG